MRYRGVKFDIRLEPNLSLKCAQFPLKMNKTPRIKLAVREDPRKIPWSLKKYALRKNFMVRENPRKNSRLQKIFSVFTSDEESCAPKSIIFSLKTVSKNQVSATEF